MSRLFGSKSLEVLVMAGCLYFGQIWANNIEIANVSLTDQDVVAHSIMVKFDLSWDNSWKYTDTWDAAWVFVKFKKSGDLIWQHATLSTTGHVPPTGCSIETPADSAAVYGRGVFIYKTDNGGGTNTWTGANAIKIKWMYGTNGVPDVATLKVKVFGVEMVLIPAGSFYVGDYNGGSGPYNCLYKYGASPDASYQITSEGAITVGTAAGNLWYDNDGGNTGDRGTPIPAAYPKGYNAYYCMKYEISQAQYRDFLNCLTNAQATNRFPNLFNSWRHYIKVYNTIYGCDADNDNTLDESADGEWIACNYISTNDVLAYLDWSALRPITELEYEKACRGTVGAVALEYAWGTANITDCGAYLFAATERESTTVAPVANYGRCNCAASVSDNGPVRCGVFAISTSNRVSAGAGYTGVMELSGNIWERVITVGNGEGRAFTGANGDGYLLDNGLHNVTGWPAVGTGTGIGVRGGAWNMTTTYGELTVAGRYYGVWTSADGRDASIGGRGVRLKP
ncbi:MAG: SUMF1/EgtB/PvdO family nonheme iron enzyme [Candidatus Stahlbacteria bacterium]|nr:SUMF1/EgtB/PvdO family nonheme iron enzyme [Candidatus Stahlbacteria bacterium]